MNIQDIDTALKNFASSMETRRIRHADAAVRYLEAADGDRSSVPGDRAGLETLAAAELDTAHTYGALENAAREGTLLQIVGAVGPDMNATMLSNEPQFRDLYRACQQHDRLRPIKTTDAIAEWATEYHVD